MGRANVLAVFEGVRAAPTGGQEEGGCAFVTEGRGGAPGASNAAVRSTRSPYSPAVLRHACQVHAGKGGAGGIVRTDGNGDLWVLELVWGSRRTRRM